MTAIALEIVKQENDELRSFISRRGYVRCDIPACNCGSFHRGHAEERLREIGEALEDLEGAHPSGTHLAVVKWLVSEHNERVLAQTLVLG